MDVRDSLLLIDMDKGTETLGPLFETPGQRLQEDPRFRSDWTQYQALRALAWEAAPELDERLMRQALQASRRQEVERKLARATGSRDAARELLLEPQGGQRQGLPVWAAFLLLAGALGLGWLAFKPAAPAPTVLQPAPGQAPLSFEFPITTAPPQAALDSPAPASHDETHSDDASTRQARRLVNQNLREAAQAAPRPRPTSRPTPRPVATRAMLATAVPTALPGPEPQRAVPTAAGQIAAESVAAPGEASFSLSSDHFPASATLVLPQSAPVDLRLFDMRGRLVHRYADASAPHGAGVWRLDLPATDEEGRRLPAGSYYLRVITRWYSKVEALEQP